MTEQCTVLEIDASSENLWTNVRKSIDSLTTEYVVLTAKGSVFSDEGSPGLHVNMQKMSIWTAS